jgi:hypothetical protein
MILALLFLPVALVVITIGLPVLIFLVSVGAMCVLAYEKCFTLTQGSGPPIEISLRRLDQTVRSDTPPPELSMLPELRTSPSLCFRPKYTRTPSSAEFVALIPNCHYECTPSQRRTVRFA